MNYWKQKQKRLSFCKSIWIIC